MVRITRNLFQIEVNFNINVLKLNVKIYILLGVGYNYSQNYVGGWNLPEINKL